MKPIAVMIVGVESRPFGIQMCEGASVGGILSTLNIEDDLLVKGPYTRRTLYNKEDDYEQVSDTDQLFDLTNLKIC